MSTTSTKTTPIRVSVSFKESSVFAGEDVQCTITFKNVASTQSAAERTPQNSSCGDPRLLHPERSRSKPLPARAPSVAQSVAPSVTPSIPSSVQPSASKNSSLHDVAVIPQGAHSAAPPGRARGHRPTLSLNTPHLPGVPRSPSAPSNAPNGSTTPVHKHGRSLSIMSIHSDAINGTTSPGGVAPPKRPVRGHGRSTSLQVVSPRGGSSGGPNSSRSLQPSPFFSTSPPPLGRAQTDNSVSTRPRPSRRTSKQGTSPGTPVANETRKASLGSFKFPPTSPEPGSALGEMSPALEISPAEDAFIVPRTRHASLVPSPGNSLTRSPEEIAPPREKLQPSPVTRIISGASMNGGSSRSSGEFYTVSNNSTETLASEYIARPTARLLPKLMQDRRPSNLVPAQSRQDKPEVLMMGYAQVMGSFTLDGSLINQGPFEEVKRKGMMGGQGGGGVVGIERTKRDSGLFGALGWSNLGESLGGLLGGAEPSSIREMRSVASAKTVPLLSTPQSILFVDLKLAPGEEKSYTYTFTLPRGLPPSHKGRAMKVNYHLNIGTQRPGSAARAVRSVTVPFRVFGSVNNLGEILGHDLMSPYIILRDQATIETIEDPKAQLIPNGSISRKPTGEAKQARVEFETYVRNLLETAKRDPNSSLLSPTDAPSEYRRRRSTVEDLPVNSMKEAIDFAILRSNSSSFSSASTNRFEIARNGRRVAVIRLARPAFRLGETISMVIDFDNADIPVYGIAVTLESSEKVDPAIALRSGASIHRVTRKVHASFAENTLFARRVSFAPTVPPNATPEFITSGVSLEWKLRVEFVTPRIAHNHHHHHHHGSSSAYGSAYNSRNNSVANTPVMEKPPLPLPLQFGESWGGAGSLMEEMGSDDRGTVLAAVERLNCESFEVAVPIRVYGSLTGSDSLTAAGEQEDGYAI
ncbi:RAB6A-GEF complex partner protein 2 [Lasiodiplodia hormozganensis]|uniref:RAB6A-GEF complex partner protein 2 n=1 Tax=Lasiodiplodia hormozganensis TaxID=869390 RepID=A0AA39YIE6_9PEZI|nr:RAB6A-GEF complex partner protein 2 [Lasiodiplodia hormozganensis]